MTDVDDWYGRDDHTRPQEEPDFDAEAAEAEWQHQDDAHGGGPCDCPPAGRVIDLPYGFPRIVVLCGSTRFGVAFRQANLALTLAGKIVLSIGCDTRSDADLAAVTALGQDPDAVKAALDDLHRRKIDLADEVLVVSDEELGYFGESTAGEIAYANSTGKPVGFVHEAAEKRAQSMGLIVEPPF